MKNKKITKNILLSLFSLLLIGNDVCKYDLKAQSNPFDFSRVNSLDSVVVSGEDLYSFITNESDLSDLEKQYLNNSSYTLKYENKIPYESVYTLLNDDELIVHATSYSYNTVNNEIITWTPSTANLNGQIVNFAYDTTENEYICSFNGVLEEDEKIDITYTSNLSLDVNTVNSLINYTYDIADAYYKEDIVGKTDKQNQENQAKYDTELVKYNQYLQDKATYEKDTISYANYLAEVDIYNENVRKYNDYLVRLEQYNDKVEKYNNYLTQLENYKKYQSYLKEKEKYDLAYAEYLEELEKNKSTYEKIDYYFAVMDLIKETNTSLERSLYNAIMGGTVTEVLARRDELTQLNVSEALIDKAEVATYNLREIFEKYYSKTTNEDKFIFYKGNYKSIRDNFINLLQALDSLYKYDIVQMAVDIKEKKPQFLILLSQLVMICNAISYEPVKDTNGVVYTTNTKFGGKTVLENLEYDYDFVENDDLAYPSRSVNYIEKPVAPEPIEVVEKVENPTEVEEPGIAPTVVNKPGNPPTVVEKPVKPEEVKEPVKPEVIKVDSEILTLINAYSNGELIQRAVKTQNECNIDLSTTFSKKFRNISTVVVEFYDLNNNFISRATAEKEGPILYEGTIPTKPSDNVYSEYLFSHWEYEDGEVLDLNNVKKDGYVYPKFVGGKLQTYEVTWNVDGKATTETYEYGEIPSYSGDLEKPSDRYYYYTFASWDKEFVEVTQNITYTAIFENHNIIQVEDDFVSITYVSSDNYIILDVSKFNLEDVDLTDFFDKIIGFENNYTIILSGVNYNIQLPKAVITQAKIKNIKNLSFKFEKTENNNEFIFEFNIYDKDGKVIEIDLASQVEVSDTFSSYKISSIFEIDENGNEVLVNEASFAKKEISFSVYSGKTYIMYPIYTIYLPKEMNDFSFKTESKKHKANSVVGFEFEVNSDVESYTLLITDLYGNVIEYENNSFVMPESNVIVSVENIVYKQPVILNYYTITFIVDGVVISQKKYLEGSEVIPPSDISKISDENYSYIFIGWDKEITNAIGDAEYTAVFEAVPVERPIVDKPKVNIVKVAKYVVLGVAIGTTIMLLMFVLFKYKVLTKAKIKAFFTKK